MPMVEATEQMSNNRLVVISSLAYRVAHPGQPPPKQAMERPRSLSVLRPHIALLTAVFIILSLLTLFSVEWTSLKLQVFSFANEPTAKSSLHYDHSHKNSTKRSQYGYYRPQPPYPPIQHISHTCLINRNTSSEQTIHLPTVVPHLILIGAQKSATSEFQVLANKHINVITPLSARKFEPHYLEFQVESALLRQKRKNNTAAFDDTVCALRQRYTAYFNMSQIESNEMSVVMEKTPSYILHENLPWVIDTLCPWKPKILAILRDPVDRACECVCVCVCVCYMRRRRRIAAMSIICFCMFTLTFVCSL